MSTKGRQSDPGFSAFETVICYVSFSSLSLLLSLSLSHTLLLSLSHTHSLSVSLSLGLSISNAHFHAFSLALTHPNTHASQVFDRRKQIKKVTRIRFTWFCLQMNEPQKL